MSYADKTITCRDCGMEFVFTAGEQEFYAQKGFTNEPTRCPSCRQQRKASGGGRGNYGSRDGGYSRDSYGDRGGDSYGSRDSYSRGPREKQRAHPVAARRRFHLCHVATGRSTARIVSSSSHGGHPTTAGNRDAA
jgi:hypothetical protein